MPETPEPLPPAEKRLRPATAPGETPDPSPGSRTRVVLNALEHSDVSGDLKDILVQYLEQRLTGPQRDAFVSNIREGRLKSVADLVEVAVDLHLAEDPRLAAETQQGEVTLPRLAEATIDGVLGSALAQAPTPDAADRVNRVLRAVRGVMSDSRN